MTDLNFDIVQLVHILCKRQKQKKKYKGFFNNYGFIFVLLGVREELENFLNFNKRSGAEGRGNFEEC